MRLADRYAMPLTAIRSLVPGDASRVIDHDGLDELLSFVLEAVASRDAMRVLRTWLTFENALTAHLDAEDETLVPSIMRSRARTGQALVEEHRYIRQRLRALGQRLGIDDDFFREASGFLDELVAHGRREDALMATLDGTDEPTTPLL
jgi:hypothetical protein